MTSPVSIAGAYAVRTLLLAYSVETPSRDAPQKAKIR